MARPAPANRAADAILEQIAGGHAQPLYLVTGDRVVAEPQARRIADALAEAAGCEVEASTRPATLARILADLRTLSLFASAKVVLAVDSAVLADRRQTADLIDQAEQGLPVAQDAELSGKERQAASRLLQALRLFGIDPLSGDVADTLAELPDWALAGGVRLRKKHSRGRSAKARKTLEADLSGLLEAARTSNLIGFAVGDLAELEQLAEGGLPDGHALVLAEPTAAADHPLVERLAARGAVVELARVAAGRDGSWEGLDDLAAELAKTTEVTIARDALAELAKRTLKTDGDWRSKTARADATGRLAAEYRKLAAIVGTGPITRDHVIASVDDRGEEDVWQILGAVGDGQCGDALDRYRRLVMSADDPVATRLSFFALLAGFCRQLTATVGVMHHTGVRGGERNYYRFKESLAPKLQADLSGGQFSPLKGLHPFRLHRAYLAASRLPRSFAARLPWLVLETEQRVKGDSRDADAAVSQLLARVAGIVRTGSRAAR